VYYHSKEEKGNILTPDALNAIHKVSREIDSLKGYTNMCQTFTLGVCDKPRDSFTNYAFFSESKGFITFDGKSQNSINQERINMVAKLLAANNVVSMCSTCLFVYTKVS
jgi:hypothetical protein